MKEALKDYHLIELPKLLDKAINEIPRDDIKVSYLRKEVNNLKKRYNNGK